jgi:hypothetical protein
MTEPGEAHPDEFEEVWVFFEKDAWDKNQYNGKRTWRMRWREKTKLNLAKPQHEIENMISPALSAFG